MTVSQKRRNQVKLRDQFRCVAEGPHCTRYAVRGECLEYAIENEVRFGIWGGFSERERRRIKRERRETTA